MRVEKFQEGGFIDEDELFTDDDSSTGLDSGQGTNGLDAPIEHVTGDEGRDAPPPPANPAPEPPSVGNEGLTGIELFLSDYGVQGGMIEFEDGNAAHFSSLSAPEQEEVLKSLTKEAIPSIEEKFNLEQDEITLINAFRESQVNNVGEFLNNVVSERLNDHLSSEQFLSVDYNTIPEDDLFIYNLKEKHPEFTDEQLADELVKAKELVSYEDNINTLRYSFNSRQDDHRRALQQKESTAFTNEVELQRHEIVDAIEGINDIAGAVINDDVKNYLLEDIMELNDNQDPVLMEKIFSNPEAMFKANWFLTYGEDYMSNMNDYWKKQVSAAYKKGYEKSINGMPHNPTIIGADKGDKRNSTNVGNQRLGFGDTVTEEELFN